MIHALLMMLAISALMHAARSFLAPGSEGPISAGTTLAFGFLVILTFYAGRLFNIVRLPKLTGYIVAGLLVGPSVLVLLTEDMLNDLGPVQGVAVCLIALAAGGELNIKRMRPLLRTIISMTGWVVLGSSLLCTLALMVLRPWLPFIEGDGRASIATCVVVGVAMSAMSPAVAMALLSELEAEGPVSRTVLGVVVLADLAVILLFSVVSSAAQPMLGGAADVSQVAGRVTWELLGSGVAGVLLGAVLALYLRKVSGGRSVFVLLLCVVISKVGSRVGLDPLIIALTVGLFAENVAEVEMTRLTRDIEAASLCIYVVFFALAGAMLDVRMLASIALPALALVVVRALGIWAGAGIAATRSRADMAVRRWAFGGLLPQAGLALALALLLPKALPASGERAAILVIGVVAINELLMPIVMRATLVRAGEVGRASALRESEDASP
jgi:Kef-type K+ transport system membrane component KefB